MIANADHVRHPRRDGSNLVKELIPLIMRGRGGEGGRRGKKKEGMYLITLSDIILLNVQT